MVEVFQKGRNAGYGMFETDCLSWRQESNHLPYWLLPQLPIIHMSVKSC